MNDTSPTPVTLRPGDAGPHLTLCGTVDVSEAAALRTLALDALAQLAPGSFVTLWVGNLDRIDTAALQVLLSLQRSVGARGLTLTLADTSAAWAAACEQLGLASAFECGRQLPDTGRAPQEETGR